MILPSPGLSGQLTFGSPGRDTSLEKVSETSSPQATKVQTYTTPAKLVTNGRIFIKFALFCSKCILNPLYVILSCSDVHFLFLSFHVCYETSFLEC